MLQINHSDKNQACLVDRPEIPAGLPWLVERDDDDSSADSFTI